MDIVVRKNIQGGFDTQMNLREGRLAGGIVKVP